MALKRGTVRPELPATLTINGQGESVTILLTYFNRKNSEVLTKVQEGSLGDVVLFLVKEWDCEYPLNLEGLSELEDDRPGTAECILSGWHEARRMSKEKN